MSNIDRAAKCMDDLDLDYDYDSGHEPSNAERAQALDADGLLTPAPQIIRTPAELEALDPDTLVLYFDKSGFGEFWEAHLTLYSINHTVGGARLPVVVVASGEHVRKCREALEGETT